jgi:hypothetical protein
MFLLKVVELAPLSIEERERRIHVDKIHYSEMIVPESLPDVIIWPFSTKVLSGLFPGWLVTSLI